MIATGKCDTTKLEKYGNNDFVVDDDIVPSSIIYEIHNKTFNTKTSDYLLRPFNPSKPFKIRCSVTFNNLISTTIYTGFVIVNNSVNLTGCKVNNTTSTWLKEKSYWFSGDDLGEFHYGNPQNGVNFIYEFSYKGDNRILEENAIVNLTPVKFRDEYSKLHYPRNLESNVIHFCYDPRNSYPTATNVVFDCLIIEQE